MSVVTDGDGSPADTECEACGQDMRRSLSCTDLRRSGVVPYSLTPPVPWWHWRRWLSAMPPTCRDCGVSEAGVHHLGCCVAWCARCDDQRLGCPCDDDLDG